MCVIYISGHNISPCHSIHTGLPVIVLSIDVECHTGSHIYPFYCLKSDPDGNLYAPYNVILRIQHSFKN